eukprot:7417105-Lingulodinium_polyedra.AAC.1
MAGRLLGRIAVGPAPTAAPAEPPGTTAAGAPAAFAAGLESGAQVVLGPVFSYPAEPVPAVRGV